MGYSSRVENVIACLSALEAVLVSQGYQCQQGQAVAAAYQAYAQQALAVR
jgi:alanine-glyoxylate transaminase/serine-glyoxylate transaminase/serine-pyruvate transaminase